MSQHVQLGTQTTNESSWHRREDYQTRYLSLMNGEFSRIAHGNGTTKYTPGYYMFAFGDVVVSQPTAGRTQGDFHSKVKARCKYGKGLYHFMLFKVHANKMPNKPKDPNAVLFASAAYVWHEIDASTY